MAIRVIGRVERNFAGIQRAAVLPRQFQGVDDRGVALQRHALAQAIREYPGDERAFVGLGVSRSTSEARRQRPVPEGDRAVERRICVCGCAEIAAHSCRKRFTMASTISWPLGCRGNPYVAGKRKPSRLCALGARSRIGAGSRAAARKSSRLVKPSRATKIRDIEHRIALGNHQLAHVDAALGERVEHFKRRHRMIEKIFAGL